MSGGEVRAQAIRGADHPQSLLAVVGQCTESVYALLDKYVVEGIAKGSISHNGARTFSDNATKVVVGGIAGCCVSAV